MASGKVAGRLPGNLHAIRIRALDVDVPLGAHAIGKNAQTVVHPELIASHAAPDLDDVFGAGQGHPHLIALDRVALGDVLQPCGTQRAHAPTGIGHQLGRVGRCDYQVLHAPARPCLPTAPE